MQKGYIIECQSLSKTYSLSNRVVKALKGVSFQVDEGIVFGLLGPNGAGKTTTIKILTTLTRPDQGRCLIKGLDIERDRLAVKRLIGVVPQENNLDRELTAEENLMIYGLLHRVRDLRRSIDEKLSMVGLSDRKNTVVSQFSGGMQRRLLLARALMAEPEILFLDEPTIGLDPQIRRQLWEVIRKTKIEGRTVILTTHYIEEAEALCDKVAILSNGEIIALDTPDNLKRLAGEYVVDVIDDSGKLTQFMYKDYNQAVAKAKEIQNGAKVRRSNLEDAFVKLTGTKIE